jgi:transcriptional regulator GlxA family with amidase domain
VSDRVVAIFGFDGMQSLDVTGPFEVFAGANAVLDGSVRSEPRYRPLLVGSQVAGELVAESGLTFRATHALARLRTMDTLVLPGGNGVHAAAAAAEVRRTVAAAARRSRRVATVCTGAFLGAATGLFEPGQRVTTHWAWASRLARTYPELVVDPDPIHVRHGQVWTSAGVTAGIDLALALVEDDLGAEVAQTVARWLVVFLRRPGGQSQFAAPVWSKPAERQPVRAALDLIHTDPSQPLDVAALAAHAGLSERHFLRMFGSEVGTTPARYVERVRIEAARRLLETEDSGLTAVAQRCGFGTAETLRRSFQRWVGVAPDQYRQRFRTAPDSG